jgi:hypothetical protein
MGYKKETWDSILAILGISISLFFPLIKKTPVFLYPQPSGWVEFLILGRFLAKISPKQQQMNVLWTIKD